MEGAALRQKHELDLAMFTAWHTAIFALNGYSGKLKGKSLSDFLATDKKPTDTSSRMRAFFMGLKAQGLPVTITRNEIN